MNISKNTQDDVRPEKNDRSEAVNEKTDLAAYFFHQGTNYHAYDYLGVHKKDNGFIFRVWAPNAVAVALAGDFDGWQGSISLTRITEAGVWECFAEGEGFFIGAKYKYLITASDGRRIYKADPYAFAFECPPDTASLIWDIDGHHWRDGGWMSARKKLQAPERPMNIYELQLSSWMRHEDGSLLSYTELARELAPYVKQMGYTHIELMPVAEHPFDGSWGYQVTGYYSPTARHGRPEEFMSFIDSMHEAGIGVILDWVPAHFPKDEHGLYEFDGQPLYEYQGIDRMEHAGWGTRCFDVGRCEVESFLISNAFFWAEMYHADGLRVDAVASMLYLDYDRMPGEWIPNVYGDNRNLEAISFFQKLNGEMAKCHPGVLMIAEESSAWSNITTFENSGLGFSYKWNMGWMNDILSYSEKDPIFRKYHHDKVTFSLMYAFSEKYILPISHDEVVHGKKSLLDRMPGEYEQKFAGVRAFLAYMMTHPGKKLLFMGCEIGQFREWDYAGQIEWFLLDYDMHAKLQLYTAELNRIYLSSPELWECDSSWKGFEWIDADNKDQSIITYRRMSASGDELLVVINFTPVKYSSFRVGVPCPAVYRRLICSDDERYGGSVAFVGEKIMTEDVAWNGRKASIVIDIPPLGALILRREKKISEKKVGKTTRKKATKDK